MSRKHNGNEFNEIENVISKIKESTIVYITTEDDGEMMFMCQRVGRGFTLYHNDNGYYSPTADSLEELKDMLLQDYIEEIITDINIYDECGDKN